MQEYRIRPEVRHTRREAVLLGASAIMGTIGAAGVARAMELNTPLSAPDISLAATPEATPEGQALSTVQEDLVASYRDRFGVFGDTEGLSVTPNADKALSEIELPYAMLSGILERFDAGRARADQLVAYGNFKSVVGVYLHEDAPGAALARDLYNPFSYLPGTRYAPEWDRLDRQLDEPVPCFAAAMTTWAVFPDAFIARFDAMPTVTEESGQNYGYEPEEHPSWEKQVVVTVAESVNALVVALAKKDPGEGEGLVNTRMATAIPRLGMVRFALEL